MTPVQAPRAVTDPTLRVLSATVTPVHAPRPATVSIPSFRVPSSMAMSALHARTPQSLNSVPARVTGTKRPAESQLSRPGAAKKTVQVIDLSDED